MKFSSFDTRKDGEYTCVGFEEISRIFVTQDEFLNGVALFDVV